MKKRTIELGNLVVLFNGKGLVESFNERFYKVILNGKVKGKGEVESYRFHGLKLDSIDRTPVFYGRLLKFMTIEAEQDFDVKRATLVDSDKRMPSVPSAFFVIDLTTHRISYLGETRRSPTLKDFEYCLKKLLQHDWREKRKSMKETMLAQHETKRISKHVREEIEIKLDKAFPQPEVRVTPLPAIKQVGKTLAPFKKITQVSIKPLSRNNELSKQNASFLRAIEKEQDLLKSRNFNINANNAKDGLEKNAVQNLVTQASSGNYQINVKGVDNADETISSDLKEISVKIKEEIPNRETDVERAVRVLGKMKQAFQRGYVVAAEASNEIKKEAMEIVKLLKE